MTKKEKKETETKKDSKKELSEILKELEAAQKESEASKEQLLRAHADLENFRKRTFREREEMQRLANANLFESLLPIFDNFKLGLEAAQKHEEAKEILKGFEMVFQQLEGFLKEQNVECFDPKGERFDPNFHDCVSIIPSEEEEGVILEVLKPGYKIGDRLLRPANVVVSNGTAE